MVSITTEQFYHLRKRQPQTMCTWVGMTPFLQNCTYKHKWWVVVCRPLH